MDNIAINLIKDYIISKFNNENEIPNFKLFIVWKCKILQNWKYLIASTLPDNMYYEITYNGDKKEWYIDAYDKIDNVCKKCLDM